MLLSMTGYGNDTFSNDNFTIDTEIKSLNSRYLDLFLKLPRELSQHEFAIRELLKSKIIRGKISVTFNLSVNNSLNEDVALNELEFNRVFSLLKKIKDSANSKEEITLDQILLFKDNLVDQLEKGIEVEAEVLVNSLERAIKQLIEMRSKEGAELKIDLEQRIENIKLTLSEIEKLSKNSTAEYFEKFKERAKKLYEEFVDDKDRFQLELAILSEKHDITEECIRLHSHIKLFNEAMLNSQDVGRKLNFICQEINREVNTINSKSISSEISHLGINIKEELEKIREQVQNIE
jgi:uncharacterized protein (TIGR00255 family)